jgi:hypothetical protein
VQIADSDRLCKDPTTGICINADIEVPCYDSQTRTCRTLDSNPNECKDDKSMACRLLNSNEC